MSTRTEGLAVTAISPRTGASLTTRAVESDSATVAQAIDAAVAAAPTLEAFGRFGRAALLRRLAGALDAARTQIVVVADRRKVSTDQFNYWSPTPARWRLLTDDDADPAALDELRMAGAQIDLAEPLRALTEATNVKGNQS